MTHSPVACTLGPAALKARREGLLADLLGRAEAHEELADGHRLRFAPSDEILGLIARTVDAERLCCRFLRFHITVEPDEGPILLELTGPEGTRDFLAAMIAAWPKRVDACCALTNVADARISNADATTESR